MPSAQFIRPMFDAIAGKYDFLNDLLSLFLHRRWKSKLVKQALTKNPKSILDAATGTGDLTFRFLGKSSSVQLTAIDFSSEMIRQSQKKLLHVSKEQQKQVTFEVQNVEQLPYQDQSFDVSTISFGIRNVEHLELALAELARVSKKGLYILEFGKPQNPFISKLIFYFLRSFVPTLGRLTKKPEAYHYLLDSSEKFPSGPNFLNILKKNTPFKTFKYETFFGGFVYLYSAEF